MTSLFLVVVSMILYKQLICTFIGSIISVISGLVVASIGLILLLVLLKNKSESATLAKLLWEIMIVVITGITTPIIQKAIWRQYSTRNFTDWLSFLGLGSLGATILIIYGIDATVGLTSKYNYSPGAPDPNLIQPMLISGLIGLVLSLVSGSGGMLLLSLHYRDRIRWLVAYILGCGVGWSLLVLICWVVFYGLSAMAY